jgi:hypothetical protein
MAKKTAPPKVTSIKVNLLYPQGNAPKLSAQFIKWVLSYGRVILVLVEMVVLGTFALRFSYDSRLADLKEEIQEQKLPFVQSLQGDEALIRQTQFKLETISKNLSYSSSYADTLDLVAGQVPANTKFKSISIETRPNNFLEFRILGSSTSNQDLASFVANLKQQTDISEISLSNIGLEEGVINFTLSGVVATKPK